jgi:hypothetical protein
VGRTPDYRQADFAELEAIRNGSAPQARDLGYEHVEVDVDRQVLMLVNDDDRVRVLPVSTGNDKAVHGPGQMSVAYTPRGRFVVYDKTFGWEMDDSDQFITRTTSVAVWRFTAISACPTNAGESWLYSHSDVCCA